MAHTMIEFHLDPRSGVAPYLQIVQQVKEALRLGLLDVGDQLPTVREVVADLAINPNTVAKGYRELESERPRRGAARPGHVHHRHAGRSLGEAPRRAPARSRALARGGRACRAGRGEHPRADLDDATGGVRTPSGMTAPLVTHGVGKRYRRRWALRDCTLGDPRAGDRRPRGAERCGQVDAPRPHGRIARSDRGQRSRCSGATRGSSRRCSPASGTSRATRRSTGRSPFATRSSSRARPTRAGTQSIAGEFLARLSSDDRVSALLGGRAGPTRARRRARQAAGPAPARRAVRAARPARRPVSSCGC